MIYVRICVTSACKLINEWLIWAVHIVLAIPSNFHSSISSTHLCSFVRCAVFDAFTGCP